VSTAQTRIPTERAGRYLTQLCQHLNQISRRPPHRGQSQGGRPMQLRRVNYSESHGIIEFTSGTCILRATSTELAIDLAADDTNDLRQLQQLLSLRLETIGRRDNLLITW
jgi:hypothetical protein